MLLNRPGSAVIFLRTAAQHKNPQNYMYTILAEDCCPQALETMSLEYPYNTTHHIHAVLLDNGDPLIVISCDARVYAS